MCKGAIYFSLFIFHSSLCLAQDTLVLKNGQKMGVKVISVVDRIQYSIPPDTKQLSIGFSNVNYIKYKDGSVYHVEQAVEDVQSKNNYSGNDTISKLFSITTDLAQYILFQPNIGVEYRINARFYAGINVGLVEPSSSFAVNPIANGQFTNPGTVYSGYAVRLYLKMFLSKRHIGYVSVQGVYKSLSFNNVNFYDQYGDAYGNNYTMSEHATTLGIDLFHGMELIRGKSIFNLDVFYGFGIHSRIRNYTISNQSFESGQIFIESEGKPIAYDGNYTNTLYNFTPVIGIRAGFKYGKRK